MKVPQLITAGLLALSTASSAQTIRIPNASAVPGPRIIAEATYFVVDASGNGDFQEIGQAAAVAPSGSIIKVLPGFYTAPIVIRNKTIQLIADESAQPICLHQVRILDVAAGDQVVVSGLDFQLGFLIEDCAGQVTLQDCTSLNPMTPIPAPPFFWDQFPLCGIGESRHTIRNCAAVTLTGCAFEGAPGRQQSSMDGMPGHHGLLVEDSTAAIYGCQLTGGAGAAATSSGHFPVASGAGGDGLQVKGATSHVSYARLTGIGGLGGTFTPGGNGSFGVNFGCDGASVRVTGGVAEEATHADLSLTAPTEVVAGNLGTYTIVGPPGAPVYLSFARSNDWTAFGPAQGLLHVPQRSRTFPVGVLPPSGLLARPFPVPTPVGASLAIRLELQLHAVVGGTMIWSEPRTVLVRH